MPDIPTYRPKGSPLARAYGATNPDGTPDHSRTPVKKSWTPTHSGVDDQLSGLSPNERAQGRRTPDVGGQRATLDALRLLNAGRIGQIAGSTRLKAVRKAKDDDVSNLVAIYDANGNLVGLADPDDIQQVSAGTPVQPAAASSAPTPPAPVAKVQKAAPKIEGLVWTDHAGRKHGIRLDGQLRARLSDGRIVKLQSEVRP